MPPEYLPGIPARQRGTEATVVVEVGSVGMVSSVEMERARFSHVVLDCILRRGLSSDYRRK